ncbi:hypothetical protein BGZ99_009184 [Dissophora globulifera]|uniref:Septin-type G domain-containing protein n=1 Tax=Dissophora globulifera TaxID=979702 RepID=A0A9P6RTH7_9FUNG|nr:hypothetical protein BGZ99_009184 [Dissophora globulifera]
MSTDTSLRFLLLGDVGVGKSTFIDSFISTLSNVQSNEVLEEFIPKPATSLPPSASLNPSPIRLSTVRVQTDPILQPHLDAKRQQPTDPLGLLPPKIQVPAREVSFVTIPGYSSTTNPSTVLNMTDNYLDHHLLTTTSIFSPSITSSQMAWFLIAGSGAHSLPTCAFYFVLYELKPVDILYMRLIHERVNLIPIITKADTLSKKELWVLKKRMIRKLKLNGINFHTFGLGLEAVETMTEQRQWGAVPFTVSTRRGEDGNLVESELQQLVKLCLYDRFRYSQEDAVRKVITWRKAFGPSDFPSVSNVERFWGERSNDDKQGTVSNDETRAAQLPRSSQPLLEAQLMSHYIIHTDTGLPLSAASTFVPTTAYSSSLGSLTSDSATQARLALIHQSTGMTVDGSTRPNEIMGDNGMNTVHTQYMGAHLTPQPIDGGSVSLGGNVTGGVEESVFKVEVPNSGHSYQSPVSESTPDLGMTHQQKQQSSLIMPGGFQAPGAFLIPASDLYPTAVLSQAPGEVLRDIWEAVDAGDVVTVQRHLNNGASPDQRNISRSTLLHRTAWQGSQPFAVMRLLISYGANVNLTNENGNTVLQNVLMKHDDPTLIKLLLDNGAESTIPNKEGMNTLEVATLFNKLESAKYLLENDLSSSEPESIYNALQRARSPDKKAMKLLLKSWQGKDGEKKRADLIERLVGSGVHVQQASHVQIQERSLAQLQNSSHSLIPKSTSVHSFETIKGDSNTDSKASSLHLEGHENGNTSMNSSSLSIQGKHMSRFNLKTMRAAAPSMNNLFGRKP